MKGGSAECLRARRCFSSTTPVRNPGISRINPLAYQGDRGRYVVFASKGGAPSNPDWYHNLRAQPKTTIEVGNETIEVIATEASGEEEGAPLSHPGRARPAVRRV